VAWVFACTATLPVLYAGGWQGDWLEHFNRMLYFLNGSIPPRIDLSARPPFFNLVAAAHAWAVGSSFASYQVIQAFLGALALLPAALFTCQLTDDWRPRWIALCFAFLLLQPTIATNVLYPWSRMLTNFFALTGVFFYARAYLDSRPGLYAIAFLALGAAVVTHFSAGTLALVLGVHFLVSAARRKVPAVAVAKVTAALIATGGLWFAWSVRQFGWARTLGSNTTAQNFSVNGLGNVAAQWAHNFSTTLVPFWDWEELARYVRQASLAGRAYDFLHLYWAGTLVGSVSGALLLTLLAAWLGKGLPPEFSSRRDVRFLGSLLAVTFVASFVTIPNLEVAGIAHLALQPLAIVGFALGLALVRGAKRWVRGLFVVAYAFEGLLFYFLKTFDRMALAADQLSYGFGANLRIKHDQSLRFIYDQLPAAASILRAAVLLTIVVFFVIAWRELVARRTTPARVE
jgi:hypothetical protein